MGIVEDQYAQMQIDAYKELKKKDPNTLNEFEKAFIAGDPAATGPMVGFKNPSDAITGAAGYSAVGDELKATEKKKGLNNASSKILGASAMLQGVAPKASRSLLGY
jgi:hypothetical protein